MLHLDENIELPNIEVYSSSAELMPPRFNWGLNIYNYISLQFHIYHIQLCFDKAKMFTFKDWDVNFLYALDLTKWRGDMPASEVINMLIDLELPKTHDLEEVKKWCDSQTELVLNKCIKVK